MPQDSRSQHLVVHANFQFPKRRRFKGSTAVCASGIANWRLAESAQQQVVDIVHYLLIVKQSVPNCADTDTSTQVRDDNSILTVKSRKLRCVTENLLRISHPLKVITYKRRRRYYQHVNSAQFPFNKMTSIPEWPLQWVQWKQILQIPLFTIKLKQCPFNINIIVRVKQTRNVSTFDKIWKKK